MTAALTDNRSFMQRLPNYITFFRLALVPVFVLLMIAGSSFSIALSIAVFIIAALSDSIDGIIARRYGAVSDFGKLLDPLVDKVLVMAALVMLVAQRAEIDGAPWVPGWMVVLVLAREIWVTGLRAVAASRGLIIEAKAAGKFKAILQMTAIVFLLLHDYPLRIFDHLVTAQFIGLNMLFCSILIAIWGAFEYTHAVLLEEREQNRGSAAS